MNLIFPYAINRNPRIGFFSPSVPLLDHRIRFIKEGIDKLTSWGYQVQSISERQFLEWKNLRSASVRKKEIYDLLADNSIDILFSVWGGKNSNDLIETLDYVFIRNNAKPIIGVSDVCVLLNAITSQARIVTYHGPNVVGKLNQTKANELAIMTSSIKELKLVPDDYDEDLTVVRHGVCKGNLVGGSLGTFTIGLSGTRYMPDFDNILFFFESASLDYYQIKQHLKALSLTGFSNRVAGLFVGNLSKVNNDQLPDLYKLLCKFTPNSSIPIIKSNLFGHGEFYNPCFPIGAVTYIDTRINKYVVKVKE